MAFSPSPPLGEDGRGLRLLFTFLLFLSRKEVGNVFDGHVAEELLNAVALLRDLPLGLEVHAASDDVLRRGEVLLAERALRLQTNLERAEAVEHDALGGIEVTVHDVDQLDEHGRHVRVLHGDILLNLHRHLLQVHGLRVDGACEPLA